MSMNNVQLHRVDLNLLVVFDALMRERHVGRAAGTLAVTSSAVSHALRRLREHFGDPLFVRHPKGMAPTELAAALDLRVREILEDIRGVLSSSERFDEDTSDRLFTIGVSDYTSSLFAVPLSGWLAARAPALRLHFKPIVRGSTVHALEFGGIDLVVTPENQFPPRFIVKKVLEESFVTVSKCFGTSAIAWTIEEFTQRTHVLVSPGGGSTGVIDDSLGELGLQRKISITLPTFLAALEIVSQSDCVLSLPRTIALRYAPRFDLKVRELPFRSPQFDIFTVTTAAAAHDAGISWLEDQMAKLLSTA
jgi:DNA-binding transcriptional LysR family regulator